MTDPGPGIVEHLESVLDPEPRFRIEGERGFTWWPAEAPQHIRADPPQMQSGASTTRVHAELALALRVAGTGPVFAHLARWNAARHGLSAARWDAATGMVSLHASVTVGAGDGPAAAQRLAHAATLQIAEAHGAGALRTALAGEPPAAAPPGGAARREPSPLVHASGAYAHREAAAPVFGAALQSFLRAEPHPWSRMQPVEGGFHAEIPVARDAGPVRPGASTALLRVHTAQPHPRFGAGLLVLLSAPVDAEPEPARAPATAALLNEAEAREWTGLDQLGAWCIHPDAGLVHATFIPSLAAQESLLERLAWQSAARARWMHAFLGRVARLRTTPGA